MATIQLRTAIPGTEVQSLGGTPHSRCAPASLPCDPVYVAHAEDAWLEDVDGNRYIDFAGGIGCLNAGHRRDRLSPPLASNSGASCTPVCR